MFGWIIAGIAIAALVALITLVAYVLWVGLKMAFRG